MLLNKKNYQNITNFIQKFKKNQRKVSIIAVSKTKSEDFIKNAIKHGIKEFGENKVQEAINKFESLKTSYPEINLHMLGPLQTNKVKKALSIFDIFHTLDREKLANEFVKNLNHKLTSNKKFFIQVNTGNEAHKSGISKSEAEDFIFFCKNELKINIVGLMCIPPIDENPRTHFVFLKKLAQRHHLEHLSMGMSNDYEIAIKEGATFIRVGTLLFGKR